MRIAKNPRSLQILPSGRALLHNTPFELGADTGGDGGIGAGIGTASTAASQAGVKKDSKAGQVLAGAGTGAAVGATIGSAIPGIGTVIGAGVGAVTGLIASLATGPGGKEHRHRRARAAIAADIQRLARFRQPLNETWYKGNLIYVLGVPGTQKEHEMTFHRYINGKDTIITKTEAIKFIGLTNKNKSWAEHTDKLILASNEYGEQFLGQLKAKPKEKAKPKAKPAVAAKPKVKTKPKGLPSDIAASIKGTVDKAREAAKSKEPTISVKIEKLTSLVDDLKDNVKKDAKKLATSTGINEDLVGKLALSLSKIDKANSLLAAVGLPKSFFV